MRNKIKSLSLTLLAFFFLSPVISGEPAMHYDQNNVLIVDTLLNQIQILEPDETGRAIFSEKLDSLTNSWYIHNFFMPGNSGADFNALTPVAVSDSQIIRRLRKIESAVKLSFNSVVRDYIDMYLSRKPIQVEIMLGLTAYYFPLFEEILDKYELPLELEYLAVIESALNPRAISRAGAVGLWQFMYGTGKGLQLDISTFVDERRDVLKSTEAAARYIRQLYNVYQDWQLVIAAYNCGPGNINKAIARTGGKTDYWQIYFALPRETRGYVAAYIAATYVMSYYREHGLTPRLPAISLNTDTIVVYSLLNLKQISDNLRLDLNLLRDLNPMYRKDIIPGTPEKGMPVRIPVDQISDFIARYDTIYKHERSTLFPENRLVNPSSFSDEGYITSIEGKTKISYTVKENDNPGYIASWFNIRTADLKKWNNYSRNLIRVGQKLAIYVPQDKTDYYRKINNLSFSAKQALIGKSVQVNQETIAQISPADNTGITSEPYEYYTVLQGDNFWTIAHKYPGISNKDIMQLNNITDSHSLHPGQRLKIKPKSN
jgi:membrane-bound lytic murein transglycosylase D